MASNTNATEDSPAQSAHHKTSTTALSGVAPLTAERLRDIYASMLKCRLTNERLNTLHAHARQSLFSEATIVPAMMDLHAGDIVALPSPDLDTLIAAGWSVRAALGAFSTSRQAGRRSKAPHSGGVSREIVSLQIGMATGAAMICKMHQTSNVVLALCSAPAALDSAHRALRLAGSQRLPLVIVAHARAKSSGVPKRDYGFPAIPVDASDAVAVYRVAQEAIYKARKGTGPTLILCASVAGAVFRTSSEPDPIRYMEDYMKTRHAWADGWKQNICRKIEHELDQTLAGLDHSAPTDNGDRVRVFSVCE